jgi:MFS family permease
MCQMTVLSASFGVFMGPLSEEFQWRRGDIALALTLATIAIATLSPFVGRLMDRFGVQQILFLSAVPFGLAFASLFFLFDSLIYFYTIFVVVGIVGAGTNAIGYTRVVALWFDQSRGLAIGIAMSGVGLTSAAIPVFAQSLISAFGWRLAYPGLAATAGLTILVAAVLLREKPTIDQQPESSPKTVKSAQTPNLPFLAHLKNNRIERRHFILLSMIVLCLAIAVNGTSIHVFPYLTDSGITPSRAALTMSLFGIGLALGKLITGVLIDHFFAPFVGCIIFLLVGTALMLLYSQPNVALTGCAIFIIGFGAAALASLTAYLASRYFQASALGEAYGYLYGLLILGTAMGPYLIGLGFDFSGSYRAGLLYCSFAVLAISLLFLKLGAYSTQE